MTVVPVLLAGLLLPAFQQTPAPICGDVVSYQSRALQAGGCDLRLMIQPPDTAAGSASPVHILVTDAVRRRVATPPWAYLHREVCVTGSMMSDRTPPTIEVTDASQLQVKPGAAPASFGSEALSRCDVPLTNPKIVREAKPQYSAEAMRARVQGVVLLDAVIGIDGTVTDARVVRGLHPDLDQEALKAVRQWLFEPGQLNGKPVPVLIEVEMTFTIRK